MIGGLLRAVGRGAQWTGRRLATRSKWLAKRLWIVTVAEIAITARRHWKRLTPEERDRLVELARQSHGRPSRNLKRREREELNLLLDKLGPWELAASAVATALPFGGGFLRRIAPKSRRAEPKGELPPP